MLFQYTHLARGAIRIVRFHPRSTPSDIHLTLEHLESYADGAKQYIVLSYCPSQQESKSVTLHGRTRMVPAPVWGILSALVTHHDTAAGYWVDAICVNQRDENEKQAQEAEMARLYASAEKVLAWCGAEDEDSERVFKALQSQPANHTQTSELAESDKDAVEKLLRRDYFKQDHTLLKQAQHVELLCGRFRCDMKLAEQFTRNIYDSPKSSQPVL